MSIKQITFEEVARAEARASDLQSALNSTLKMLKGTKWAGTEKYEAAYAVYKAYEAGNDGSGRCLTEPLIEIARKAYELVQADHACILGRLGCEQRWDACMASLKTALDAVKFNT